jgi:hypothetical protein
VRLIHRSIAFGRHAGQASPPVPTRNAKPRRSPAAVPTSATVDDFSKELEYAGDRADLDGRIVRLRALLAGLDLDEKDRQLIELGRGEKKNFAQRLSTAIAQKTADVLRSRCPGINPGADGRFHESKSAGSKGLKKLDVNYSTVRSGLELAVSIKTYNFKDETTGRFTKNSRRLDGELRAEAQDCHERQPFAVLSGYLFLPDVAANDGKLGPSSLKHNANVLAQRTGRVSKSAEASLFELVFIGVYSAGGSVRFFKADSDVPDNGLPGTTVSFSDTLAEICASHEERNRRR